MVANLCGDFVVVVTEINLIECTQMSYDFIEILFINLVIIHKWGNNNCVIYNNLTDMLPCTVLSEFA